MASSLHNYRLQVSIVLAHTSTVFFQLIHFLVTHWQQPADWASSSRISRPVHSVRPHVQPGHGIWQLTGFTGKRNGGQKCKTLKYVFCMLLLTRKDAKGPPQNCIENLGDTSGQGQSRLKRKSTLNDFQYSKDMNYLIK